MGRHSEIQVWARSEQDTDSVTEPQHSNSDTKGKSTSFLRQIGVPALIVLVGVAIMLYPIISTIWNNMAQAQAAKEYEQLIAKTDPDQVNEKFTQAETYNQTRTIGPVLDPWSSRLVPENEPYKAYLEQLDLSDVMARIVIPKINVDLPVYHGTHADTLERGVGHLFGTDLPIGGENTHSVLTGHSGLQTATLFDRLSDLTVNDSIYLDVYGKKLRYVVYSTVVVKPEEAGSLFKQQGKDLLTLITCTPYGVNSHRLLVHAQRAPLDAESLKVMEEVDIPLQWWMWLFIGIALVTIIILGLQIFRAYRRYK